MKLRKGWGKRASFAAVGFALLSFIGGIASAAPSYIFSFNGYMSIDGGSLTQGTIQTDPTSGLQTYRYAVSNTVAGDLFITDANYVTTALIRFDGAGGMYFYSLPTYPGPYFPTLTHLTFDTSDMVINPAYIPFTTYSPNVVAFYTPSAFGSFFGSTSAGYDAHASTQASYTFIVSTIPEPNTGLLFGLVGLPILGIRMARRLRAGKTPGN